VLRSACASARSEALIDWHSGTCREGQKSMAESRLGAAKASHLRIYLLLWRRRASPAIMPRTASNIAYDSGSGTAVTSKTNP
jgi:hypothetical protein